MGPAGAVLGGAPGSCGRSGTGGAGAGKRGAGQTAVQLARQLAASCSGRLGVHLGFQGGNCFKPYAERPFICSACLDSCNHCTSLLSCTPPSGPPLQDLARWVRSNAVAVSGSVSAQPLPPALLAALREAPLPESASGYWPAVARLAALGWIDDALELLGLHSAWLRYDGGAAVVDEAARGAVGALEAATLLLRRFPVLRQPGVSYSAGRELATPSELLAYRRTWQAQAAALLSDAQLWRGCEAGDKATAEGLRQLLRVLGGDDAALASATRSWLELLVAQLLHVYPSTQQPAELAQLAQRAYDSGGGAGAPEFLQAASALLEAAVELDAQAAMRVCSALCSEWFMAHAPLLLLAHPSGEGGVDWEAAGLPNTVLCDELACMQRAVDLKHRVHA